MWRLNIIIIAGSLICRQLQIISPNNLNSKCNLEVATSNLNQILTWMICTQPWGLAMRSALHGPSQLSSSTFRRCHRGVSPQQSMCWPWKTTNPSLPSWRVSLYARSKAMTRLYLKNSSKKNIRLITKTTTWIWSQRLLKSCWLKGRSTSFRPLGIS